MTPDAHYPQTQSLLMDESVLSAHRELAIEEPQDSRNTGSPAHLTEAEQAAFHALLENRYGYHLRLEQEGVPFGELQHALADYSIRRLKLDA